MRLLNTKNFGFHEFLGTDIPQYSIFSHTWGDGEVSYQDMLGAHSLIEVKSGFNKIRKAAEVAYSLGYDFIWVDTCCIDKSSSAELTEAINSMYQWYKESSLCLAYLADSPGGFGSSRWFTRGWTLQEQSAPAKLLFLSSEWSQIGWKADLGTEIHSITGIPEVVLRNEFRSTEWCVAEKMSWAAQRQTTRPEDMAYCLLGLFDINMPLLYGEGNRAFSRLQEEIIKHNNDHTIFLWSSADNGPCSYRGLLARSPEEFQNCHNIAVDRRQQMNSAPFSMTNAGLHLDIALIPWTAYTSASFFLSREPIMKDEHMIKAAVEKNIFIPVFNGTIKSIFLVKLNQHGGQYARVWTNMTPRLERSPFDMSDMSYLKESILQKFYVRQDVLIPQDHVAISSPEILQHPIISNTGLDARWTHGVTKGIFLGPPSLGRKNPERELLYMVSIDAEVHFKSQSFLNVVIGYDSDNGHCWCDLDHKENIPENLGRYRRMKRSKWIEHNIWSGNEWACFIRVEKEVINGRLVLSVRAKANFLNLN